MTEDQIRRMATRFLTWRLPEDFRPDGGVSFERLLNTRTSTYYPPPTGTNLFSYTQALAMVRYMVEGMPTSLTDDLPPGHRVWNADFAAWLSVDAVKQDGPYWYDSGYPFMRLAKEHGVDYGDVLIAAEYLDHQRGPLSHPYSGLEALSHLGQPATDVLIQLVRKSVSERGGRHDGERA